MKFFVAMLFLVSCGPSSQKASELETPGRENQSIAKYLNTYEDVLNTLKSRIFITEAEINLAKYVEKQYAPDDVLSVYKPSLLDLLPAYSGDGLGFGLKNATPNAVNMLLWHIILDGIARDLSRVCVSASPKPPIFGAEYFQESLLNLINHFCDESPLRRDQLSSLWQQIVSYDADDSERQRWLNFATGPELNMERRKVVYEILFSALYNPYLLLRN